MKCPALETYRNIGKNCRSKDIPTPSLGPFDISKLQEFVEIIYPLISTFKTLAGIHLTRAFFATYKPCVSIGIPGARVFMKLSFRFNLFVWRIHSKDPQVELPAELSIFS